MFVQRRPTKGKQSKRPLSTTLHLLLATQVKEPRAQDTNIAAQNRDTLHGCCMLQSGNTERETK